MSLDILVTGAYGQLGRSVLVVAARRGLTAIGTDFDDMPVEDRELVATRIALESPGTVLHCGALTDVDGCELDPDRAEAVNGRGTGNVVAACSAVGCGLLYLSTDFVFDGRTSEPYREDHPAAPLSAYGHSKRRGEEALLAANDPAFTVVRTSWVFGPGGKNFPAAILARARQGGPLQVVDDQIGRPTYTEDLAEALLDLADLRPADPILHAANEGHCSWHGFACDLVAAAGLEVEVQRIGSTELDRPAPRPPWSVLATERLTALRGRPLPDYRDAIRRYLVAEEALL